MNCQVVKKSRAGGTVEQVNPLQATLASYVHAGSNPSSSTSDPGP